MKSRNLKQVLLLALLLSAPAFLQAKTIPPQLSADITMYQKNKVFDEGKLYIGKSAGRMDWPNKMKQTQIYHFNADKVEAWMNKGNMIIEMKMPYNALIHQLPEGFKEECNGEETIEGHPCKKCKITVTFLGQKVNATAWEAKDLQMIIKNMDENGNGMTIKNIARGPQPDTLFQAPAGYRKLNMPGLGDLFKPKSN